MFITKYSNYKSKYIFKPENLETKRNAERQKNQPELSNVVFILNVFHIIANMVLYCIYISVALCVYFMRIATILLQSFL